MACVRISSNVTTTPPRVWVPSPSLLLWSILPEDLRGLHAGKQAECGKAFRPARCLPHSFPVRLFLTDCPTVKAPENPSRKSVRACRLVASIAPTCPPLPRRPRPMSACQHLQLVLVRDTHARLRCRHCHLTIKAADLPTRYCPECFETTRTKRYDFDEVVPVDSGIVYYRCEACGSMIETR